MPKRRATKKQLRNLAKGRAIRKRNLLKKRRQTRRQKPKRKMAKRRRTNGSLTGGTHDINPQILTSTWEQLATVTTYNIAIPNPVAKGIFSKANNATLMEILKVTIYCPGFEAEFTASLGPAFRRLSLGTKNFAGTTTSAAQATNFVVHEDSCTGAFTAAGSFAFGPALNVFTYDLTDGVGHGLLIATDYLYAQSRLYPANIGDSTWTIKILYRFKNVGITEYVGIIQSQQ